MRGRRFNARRHLITRQRHSAHYFAWDVQADDALSGVSHPKALMVKQCGQWRHADWTYGTRDWCDPPDDCCAQNAGPSILAVSATDSAASESGDTGTFTITRTGNTASALTVYFGLTGTATLTMDYTASASSSVTFAANETSKTVTITPVVDALTEGSETVVLSLVLPVTTPLYNIDLTAQSATVTISDS